MFTNKCPQHFPTDLVAIFAKELGHTGGRFTTLASSAWVTTKVLATKTHQVVGFLSHLQMVWCVYLQIWVKGGLFCGANFETEGLRGLKYIGNFNCSLKNLMAETLPFLSIGKMYYCRWCFQPKLKKYYGSQIGAFPHFSVVNKKQSLKSSSIHFPKQSVFYWDSSFQTFHHSNPPKSLKDMHHGLWRDSLCNNVLQRRSPKQPLGVTISEFVVLCIRWWTNMLRVKNQYDEIMSLRVQEPFHLLETEHEQPQGQRYLTP